MGSSIRLAEKPGKHKGTCVPAPRLLCLYWENWLDEYAGIENLSVR